MAASLDKRAAMMERDAAHHEKMQKERIAKLTTLMEKGGKDAKHIKILIKREEHNYKKWSAQSKHDIASMKEAAAGVRSGDLKAVDRARNALIKSLEAMNDRNAGMLVLLQEGNTALETDCPFCAAQCVEKCHNRGESYVGCLTECADA